MSYFQRRYDAFRLRPLWRTVGTPTPPTPTPVVIDTTIKGAIFQGEKKSRVRRYVYPEWAQAADAAELRAVEAAQEQAIEEAAVIARAQEDVEAASLAVATAEAEPIDDALLQSIAESLIAASLQARQPIAVTEPIAVAPTYPVPDDLYFAPIVVPVVVGITPWEIMEAVALIDLIEEGVC